MDSDSESDDDVPLVSKTSRAKNATKGKNRADQSEDSDVPLGVKVKIEKRAEVEDKAVRKEEKVSKKKPRKEDSDGDEQPVKKKRSSIASPSSRKKQANGVEKGESKDHDALTIRKPADEKVKPGVLPSALTPNKKATKVKSEEERELAREAAQEEEEAAEEAEEEYRWWEDPTKGDGTIKWTTLEHNGVVFPPPYEPLPENVKLVYDGRPVSMSIEAEEIAGFFGTMLNSTHNVENPTFQKNFFEDFTAVLTETGGARDRHGNEVSIREFSKCDFKPIFEYYEAQRAAKKALSAAERKALKAEKDAVEAPYLYCMWDGRKQKVGNFRVEPPGLFRGRGEHPKTGKVKKRVLPEQITINIGKEARVPSPPEGHRWKEIKHDQEGTWLAMWQENINGAYKYVMLAANSDIKGQSDYKKFEKARELKV